MSYKFTAFRSKTSTQSNSPLTDEQIRRVAPSIFAEEKHDSRSDRYTYIPTIEVLNALRKEGFDAFFSCQTRVRDSSKIEHTRHMLRLRHSSQIEAKQANEIILLNSHDGSSSYKMLSGVYRFVCANGMVFGDSAHEVRVPHKGNVIDRVIEGAYTVLNGFEAVDAQREGMQLLTLNSGEQAAFARAALSLRYDDPLKPAPITESQLLATRRLEDRNNDLWTTFNRVQENLIRGGLHGRNANGKSTTTRPVGGIQQNISLNRALWTLGEEMRRLKSVS